MSPVNNNMSPKNRPQRSAPNQAQPDNMRRPRSSQAPQRNTVNNAQRPAPRRPVPSNGNSYGGFERSRSGERPANRPATRPANRPANRPAGRPVNGTSNRPARPPQQNQPYPRRRRGYEDTMQRNFVRYQQQTRFRKKMVAIISVLVVLTTMISILVISRTGCLSGINKKKEVNHDLEQANAAINTAIESVSQLSKKLPELITPEPKYNNPHTYKFNSRRFSTQTVMELDEEITSEFVALYDVTKDEVIYSKKYSEKCFPASTTKLLTAVTASSIIKDPNTVITVGDEIEMIDWESSRAYIKKGTQLTFEMLMDALLLPSGNDAAYTMAVSCARIYKNDPKLSNKEALKVFMDLCNDCAKKIGATHTHFTAPDGIHDKDHYTSAQDLMIIADYAKSIPIIAKSCSKTYVDWTPIKGSMPSWKNTNKLIKSEEREVYSPYCDGMKTGYTDEAGSSVVASATMEGHTFIAVVMNGQTLYTKYFDCNNLFKRAFALYDLEYTSGDGKDSKGENSKDEDSKNEDSEDEDSENEDSEDEDSEDEDSQDDDSQNDDSQNDDSQNDDSQDDDSQDDDSQNDDSQNDDSQDDDSQNDDDQDE